MRTFGHDHLTPPEYLKKQMPEINDKIWYVVPIIFDKVTAELGQ